MWDLFTSIAENIIKIKRSYTKNSTSDPKLLNKGPIALSDPVPI